MDNLEGLLLKNLEALRASKRQRIHATLTNDPSDLEEQVAQHVFEFHQEYLDLQKDYDALKLEVDRLRRVNDVLRQDVETLSDMRIQHNAILKGIYNEEVCGVCPHSIHCGSHICRNCAKIVCNCCYTWCQHPVDGKPNGCFKYLCKPCHSNVSEFCPKHNYTLSVLERLGKEEVYKKRKIEWEGGSL